jgi:hypothetical protein
MTTRSKSSRNERNRQAIVGVQKHVTSAIVLDGVTRQPADVVSILQDAITKTDATTAAEGAFHQAVAAEKTATALAEQTFEALKGVVLNLYTGQPTVLADFGISEPVRKVPTAATKAEAAAKRKATAAAKKAAEAAEAAPAPATPATPPKS